MPDYSLVVNSQFQPFSYQEMLAPVLQATQAQQDIENQYSMLDSEANTIQQRALTDSDSEWAKKYTTYTKQLEDSAADLAANGLTPSSRSTLLKLKRDYSSNVNPALMAIQRQAEIARTQQAKNGEGVRMVYGAMPSIDQLIADPNLDRVSYSGKDIEASAANSAAAASARHVIDNFKRDPANAGWMKHIKETGYSSQAFNALLNEAKNSNDPNVNILAQITNQVKQQFSNFEGVSDADKHRLEGEILSGLFKGSAYRNDDSYQTDPVYMAKLQSSLEEGRQIRAENRALARENPGQTSTNGVAPNPINMYSPKEKKEQAEAISKFKQYFYRDSSGQVKMTYKGLQEYRRNAAALPSSMAGQNLKQYRTTGSTLSPVDRVRQNSKISEKSYVPSEFRVFMDKLGAKHYIDSKNFKGGKGWQPGNLGNLWSRYSSANNAGKYDATKATQYEYKIAKEQQDITKDNIIETLNNSPAYEVAFNGTKLARTGKTLSYSDLYTNGRVVATRLSPYGNTFVVIGKSGKVSEYEMPPGINPTNEGNRDKLLKQLPTMQQVLKTGKAGKYILKPKEKENLQSLYDQNIESAYMYNSQLNVTNTTEPQKAYPYSY